MHKIIDSHSHLGDIFAYEKNVIYKGLVEIDPGKHNPFESFSQRGFEGPFLDPEKPEQVQNVIDMTAEVSYANTLAKLSRDLDEAQVDYVCMYPIAPYMNFEDYRVAALVEPRIIPFTSADWRSGDARAIGEKLLADAEQGAKGLKIHPILQKICLRDPLVEGVLEIWSQTGLPVVSHCGVNSYYPEGCQEFDTQEPGFGNLEDFIYLASRMPQVKFIAAHAGGLTGGEAETLAAQLGGADNLWVDTTFRSAAQMGMLVELFGVDRVLFGVDRPFGLTLNSVEAAFSAFGKGTEVSEKVMYGNMAGLIGLES
jgi:predicted TIM-barrel fold metal-dependent hydrolase